MTIWRIQGKVSPNLKDLLQGLLLVCETSYWWHRVPCLGNLNDAWWMCWSLDSPSSPPENLALQAPAHPPSPSFMYLVTCPWWGRRFENPIDLWGFGPISRLEAHGSWNFVLSVFVIFAILWVREWPAPDYHISLVFMNEPRKKFAQVPISVKNMMWKCQCLTYMFNIRYGYFRNQLIIW